MPARDPVQGRKATRLRTFDYRTPALYHVVTITAGTICRSDEVREGVMICNDIGEMIDEIWNAIPEQFPGVSIDASVVMPNHIHEANADDALSVDLGDILKWFKGVTGNRYSRGVHERGWPPYDRHFWHRNYYDHIVRDEADLERIRTYIANNSANWNTDRHYRLPEA